MSDTVSLTVIIADRPYPIKVKPEEEAMVQQAAKVLNTKISEYQRQFQAKDKQDYLAMSALMNMVEMLKKAGPGEQELTSLTGKLDKVNAIVAEALKK
jgi:cell division protein ZapA